MSIWPDVFCRQLAPLVAYRTFRLSHGRLYARCSSGVPQHGILFRTSVDNVFLIRCTWVVMGAYGVLPSSNGLPSSRLGWVHEHSRWWASWFCGGMMPFCHWVRYDGCVAIRSSTWARQRRFQFYALQMGEGGWGILRLLFCVAHRYVYNCSFASFVISCAFDSAPS